MKIGTLVYVVLNTKTGELRGVFATYKKALEVIEKYTINEDKRYMQTIKTQFLG